MDRLIFTAVAGMNASMTRQRVIASNLANAQTVGFRAEELAITPMTLKGLGFEARAMSDAAVHGASLAPGALTRSGRALDIAATGDAMIAVQAENGDEAYTRRGDLSVDPGGVLINGDGRPVIGNGGPISVPAGFTVTISPDGSVLAADPATPDTPAQAIDRIKLASTAGSRIGKATDGLFRVIGGGVLPGDEAARVEPGALEQSNVNAAGTLVEMVEAQRLFEMRTKLIATAREVDEGGTSLLRMN